MDQNIVELYKAGKTYSEIQTQLGCNAHAIIKAVVKAGLPVRRVTKKRMAYMNKLNGTAQKAAQTELPVMPTNGHRKPTVPVADWAKRLHRIQAELFKLTDEINSVGDKLNG